MAFTKITASGIGSTETVTIDGLSVINDGSFGGNVTIGGTLTYEDVTNIDSVGLITARAGVNVGSGITLSKDGDGFFTGVVTATSYAGSGANLTGIDTDLVSDTSPQLGGNLDVNTKNIVFGDSGGASDDRLTFGAGTDLSIYHDGTHTYLNNTTGNLRIQNNGTVKSAQFEVDLIDFNNSANSAVQVRKEPAGNVKIFKNLSVAGVATVGSAVTISESGIEASGIGITVANINGGAIGGRRNIIINGAMQISQRATSSTSSGYTTIDRFQSGYGNFGISMTQSQQSLSSSDTGPYGEGFRNYKRIQLASNAFANANANAYAEAATYKVEAQDLANSGWDPASATNFITLSFWFRCSTNQAFRLNLRSEDGTARMFSTDFTASANNTWTKIVKTIPGNTSPTVEVDNDNGSGLAIFWAAFYGTDYTDSGSTMDAWKTYSGSSQGTDMASTWLTAGASTFDLTGVQLEFGSQATAFERRSIGEELALCQRYYEQTYDYHHLNAQNGESDRWIRFKVSKRANPTVTTAPTNSVSFAAQNQTTEGFAGNGSGNSHANFNMFWTADSEL